MQLKQSTAIEYLQGSTTATATANGNGTPAAVDGYLGAQIMEVAETGGGTVTLALQGSYDGSNWIGGVGYQQTDGITNVARATGNISVLANSRHVYQILDPYPQVRAVLSAAASSPQVVVRVYCVPA